MKIYAKKIVTTLIIIFLYIIFSKNLCFAETVKTMTIVLDPGHGGHESGSINYDYGIMEKDINLKTTRYLRDYLNNYYGINIIMTHDGLADNQEMEIVDRSMVARNNNADLLLCLHYNATGSIYEEANGAEVYVTSRREQYKYYDESKEIGELILRNLGRIGIASRGVKTRLCNDTEEKWQYYDGSRADYYGIIRYCMKGPGDDRGINFSNGSGIQAILIEHAFIRGSDFQFINTDEKLKRIGEADGQAIVEHFNLKLKTEVPNSITLDKDDLTLFVGEKQTVNATIKPDSAKNKKVIWKSSDSSIVKVDENGVIEAIAEGTAKVTAIADGNEAIKKEITVNTIQPHIDIENGAETSVIEGNKIQLFTDIGKLDCDVVWKSEDENIASVDSNGLVQGLKAGNTKITATIEKFNVEASITINVTKLSEEQKIEIIDYKEENGVISNFDRETNKENFIKHFNIPKDFEINITYLSKDNIYVGTSAKIEILDSDKNVVQTYITKLYGDVDGDGIITARDYTFIKNDIMNLKKISSEIMKSTADVDNDNVITTRDYTFIKNDIMNLKKIEKR